VILGCAVAAAQPTSHSTRIAWGDIAPTLGARLEAVGITSTTFPSFVERAHESNVRRVREGDLDHLVFYVLQSTRFTSLPPIEPALSAKALVDGLTADERDTFLRTSKAPPRRIAAAVRSRMAAFIRAIDASAADARLAYFRSLVTTTFPHADAREQALLGEYLRAMRFLYEKEFVAQRSARPADAVEELYRTRGLSTDTAVESGYLVYLGLGVIKSLEPDRRIRRVLIVGPGLDLAPRTALLEVGPPESYQPWAVMDALLALGLSRLDDLAVVGADINPRVVDHLQQSRTAPPVLTLASGIREDQNVTLSPEYRDYFTRLGRAVGETTSNGNDRNDGHLRKTVRVRQPAAHALDARLLDVVTERLAPPAFDLVIATNVLPYFDDTELTLALANIASMLAPGGIFLHNEPRPLIGDLTAALGLSFEQSRQAVIATVRNAPAPLVDTVWLHRNKQLP
jgi:SAM-dependent methyltransferase